MKLERAGDSTDEVPRFTKDFGFLPIPRRLRYDPEKPFHFGLLLNISFGFASTFGERFGLQKKFTGDLTL